MAGLALGLSIALSADYSASNQVTRMGASSPALQPVGWLVDHRGEVGRNTALGGSGPDIGKCVSSNPAASQESDGSWWERVSSVQHVR